MKVFIKPKKESWFSRLLIGTSIPLFLGPLIGLFSFSLLSNDFQMLEYLPIVIFAIAPIWGIPSLIFAYTIEFWILPNEYSLRLKMILGGIAGFVFSGGILGIFSMDPEWIPVGSVGIIIGLIATYFLYRNYKYADYLV